MPNVPERKPLILEGTPSEKIQSIANALAAIPVRNWGLPETREYITALMIYEDVKAQIFDNPRALNERIDQFRELWTS